MSKSAEEGQDGPKSTQEGWGPSRLVYDLWPEVGKMLGLTRNATYAAANRGEIPIIRFGKLMKVPKAAFDRKLEAAGCAPADSTKPGGS